MVSKLRMIWTQDTAQRGVPSHTLGACSLAAVCVLYMLCCATRLTAFAMATVVLGPGTG